MIVGYSSVTDEVVARLQTVPCRGEAVSPAALVALLMRCDARCYLLLLRHAQLNTFCRHLLGEKS